MNAVNIDEALACARALDEELKSGHKRGPFHGIPISVKDMIQVKNFPATRGFTMLSYNLQNEDYLIIDALRRGGAVFYVTGTVP
ncbi:unnamed protein product [Blepharisma stoltei]|uniref:Amidase domain-containing protein n=1 Tax=Blepharisma stoltei TaxID=1481888 RepID=A0AAU9JEE4_9CILI|nr:unnamed protein product [Blepharisma stoltei]